MMTKIKNIGLFFVSPFIALLYIVALPIYGLGKFAQFGVEAYRQKRIKLS